MNEATTNQYWVVGTKQNSKLFRKIANSLEVYKDRGRAVVENCSLLKNLRTVTHFSMSPYRNNYCRCLRLELVGSSEVVGC